MSSDGRRSDGRRATLLSKVGTAILLVVILGVSMPMLAGSFRASPPKRTNTGFTSPRTVENPDPYVERIPHNAYYYLPFDDPYDASIQLQFQVTSTVGVDVYVMSQSQFAAFESSGTAVALYHGFGTDVTGSVSISAGNISYLVVWNDASQTTAVAQISGSTNPVDVSAFYSGPPAPVGIADYGVEDYAGKVLPYEVTTAEVVGNAKIYSLGAYNATPPAQIDPDGATLQLNVILGVNTTSAHYVYWLQNVATLRTGAHTVYFQSEIFNETVPNANLSASNISGKGVLLPARHQNTYYYDTPVSSYALPYYAQFVVSESQNVGSVTIRYGYATSQTGPPSQSSTVYFDSVTISEPGSVSASGIVVDGYKMNPFGAFYDAEFVFCGEGNGEATTFTQMNSVLSLSYLASSGAMMQPRSLYEFGSDTAESAYNLQTTYSGGTFAVGIGSTSFREDYVLAAGAVTPLTFSYSVMGGSPAGVSPPTLTFTSGGATQSVALTSTPTVYYIDNGTSWIISSSFSNTLTERWIPYGPTSGTVTSPVTVSLVYYHQYSLSSSYAVMGGGTPAQPSLAYASEGAGQSIQLTGAQQSVWADAGSSFSATNPLAGAGPTERWFSDGTNGTLSSASTLSLVYYHQYLLTTVSLTTTTTWEDAGSQLQDNVQEVFGRSDGVGYRISSVSLDGGTPQAIPLSTGTVPYGFVMNSPHTVTFTLVRQFQVTLQGDTSKALSSITSPTIAGDQYWYDAGSSVSVVLSGVWDRGSGSGSRVTSYSVDGSSPVQTNTLGKVSVLSISSVSSAHTISANVVSQYQLSTPTGLVSSITSPPIANDSGWYDSGTVVTIDYESAWGVIAQQSRLAAVGYSVDAGGTTPIGTAGNSTFAVSVTMNAPHFVNIKTVVQYFVRFEVTDASGSTKLNFSALQISVSGQPLNVSPQGFFLDNSTAFTLSNLIYEGVDVKPQGLGQYTVSGPTTIPVKALVYDAELKVTDFLGLPVSGAAVKMTLANGTVISGTTRGDGTFEAPEIPLGTYTASVSGPVTSAKVAGDASKEAVSTVGVLFSTVSLALVVCLAAVAIGVSVFLIRRHGPTSVPSQALREKARAICPNCGASVGESEAFCTNCGTSLGRPPQG